MQIFVNVQIAIFWYKKLMAVIIWHVKIVIINFAEIVYNRISNIMNVFKQILTSINNKILMNKNLT